MSHRSAGLTRRAALLTAFGLGVATLYPAIATAQNADSPFRGVDAVDLGLDRAGVWTLHFGYIPPRIAELDVPGKKGKQVVWYMPYYVYNKTGQSRTIYPEFELVVKDPDGPTGTFLDEPLPAAFDTIVKTIEDKSSTYNYQTTIGISKLKIPEVRPNTYDEAWAVHGIAVWMDAPKVAPNNFSIYVGGLSNGRATKETKDGKLEISKKTLRLDFKRPTDNVKNRFNDIRINDNNGLGSEEWVYRPVKVRDIRPSDNRPTPPPDEGK